MCIHDSKLPLGENEMCIVPCNGLDSHPECIPRTGLGSTITLIHEILAFPPKFELTLDYETVDLVSLHWDHRKANCFMSN